MNDRKFYVIDKEFIPEFKKEVVSISDEIILEEKYKKPGIYHRTPTDKSLEWILEQCITSNDVKICDFYEILEKRNKFEVVFAHDWYFAWCDIPYDKKDYFIEKYSLKKLN